MADTRARSWVIRKINLRYRFSCWNCGKPFSTADATFNHAVRCES